MVNNKDIEQLIYELFDGKFKKEISQEYLDEILGQDNYHIFTRNEDDKIVGMVSMYIIKLPSRKKAVIEEVVTLNNYRNKGIGSNLIGEAISKAKELKCDCIELTVRRDKPDIKRFYENKGFKDRDNDAMRLPLKND